MSLCNQTTVSGIVCMKAWLQHQNALTTISVSTPNALATPGPSSMVAPTQAPVAIWAPPLNTQSANLDRVTHYQNHRHGHGVPTSAFNASAPRRSTGQRNIAPRSFCQENVPVTAAVPVTDFSFMAALMPYAVRHFVCLLISVSF
jgi:hypothetical protein